MPVVNPIEVETESPSIESLLAKARAGSTHAFGEICRTYENRLLRQAMTLCGNPFLAEELAQDTLVEAWKSLARYHGGCQFFTWLCAILLNLHRNVFRKKRLLPFTSLTGSDQDQFDELLANAPDQNPPPDETSLLREHAALVWQCIQTLPLKQQQVVYLRFYVDDSLDGIASALGCSVGTVKSRLFHALEKLRGMNAMSTQFANFKTKGQMP